ncbi:MAG: DegT/DnrJ/EryC1/StrS family aminotransferase [Nitrososphaerota archaeon]
MSEPISIPNSQGLKKGLLTSTANMDGVRVPINRPLFGDEELKAVMSVVKDTNLTSSNLEGGKKVREFEQALASYLKVKDVVAVNSGTSALLSSLMAADIGPGDEVIVPSFTFAATANVVKMAGATPVFADILLEDYCIDPDDVAKKITEKTKAIIPVDIYGHVSKVKEIKEIAYAKNIVVIEDAAQSLGSMDKGSYAGSIADMACFSFYASKVITTGEGGAVAVNDQELARKLRMIRNHGMIQGYDTTILGLNMRMPEVEAAIGVEQMKRLESFIQLRRRNANAFTEKLRECKDVVPPYEPETKRYNYYLYTIYVKNPRDALMQRLRGAGYGAVVYYDTPVHMTPYYQKSYPVSLKNTEDAAKHVLSLPVHPAVKLEEVEEMAVLVKSFGNA